MTSAWVFKKIALIVLSILMGLAFYYITSPSEKTVKKQQLEESLSLIINFVLFIWVGKILLNINIFITDPLAVLAYPSDANAFYVAVLFLLVNLVWKVNKNNFNIEIMLAPLMPIFLGSAFSYEFIDIVLNGNSLSWGHLTLLFISLIVYLMRYEKMSAGKLAAGIFALWSVGQIILTTQLPFTVLYGYMMDLWFLVLVFIISVISIIYNKRKVTSI